MRHLHTIRRTKREMPLGANAVCDESIADKFGTERTPRQNARKKQAIEIDRIRMDFWGLRSTMTGSTMSMTIFPRNLHGGSTPCQHLLLSELAADTDPDGSMKTWKHERTTPDKPTSSKWTIIPYVPRLPSPSQKQRQHHHPDGQGNGPASVRTTKVISEAATLDRCRYDCDFIWTD
jgi:hypothetical protein